MEDIKFEVVSKIAQTKFKFRNVQNISKIESNSPPSVFIGSKLKYPLVNLGILSPLDRDDNAWVYDSPKFWSKENFEINDVLKLRNSLLNSRFQARVQDSRLNKKFVEMAKEIAMASKPVDVEIGLKNRMKLQGGKDRVLTPHGMRASLGKAKITSNVKIDKKVDKVVNDDLRASEGLSFLYKNNFDENVLSKILSVGVLGLKKNRKIVPTRWSITATDDILGKDLIKQIKSYRTIENYELFQGEFMGNQYLVFLFPEVWSFELFELYLPGSSWNPSVTIKASTDYESYSGRKSYAFSTAGGYYASRLPILEYLNQIKRQASVLVVRIETISYWAALGVWVVRESVRKALENIYKFNEKEDMIKFGKKVSSEKYNFDISDILRRSILLKQIKEQKTLKDWF